MENVTFKDIVKLSYKFYIENGNNSISPENYEAHCINMFHTYMPNGSLNEDIKLRIIKGEGNYI